jgi:aminoglycoside phosphotransferase (APT) family kinase protein
LEYLEKRAIVSRRRHQTDLPPDVACRIDPSRFTSGFDNLIVELAFSDKVYWWVAQMSYRNVDTETKISLLSEIATMKIIRQRTSIPVPLVFDFEMSTDQPFGYPYILMECLAGRSLDNGIALSTPPQHHTKVAKHFANVFAELQKLTFDRIGRLWCGENADQAIEIIPMAWHHSPGLLETSLEYFCNQRQGEIEK